MLSLCQTSTRPSTTKICPRTTCARPPLSISVLDHPEHGRSTTVFLVFASQRLLPIRQCSPELVSVLDHPEHGGSTLYFLYSPRNVSSLGMLFI